MSDSPGHSVTGACLDCRYRLEGSKGNRCPECGRAFDPDDLQTMYIGRVPGKCGLLLLAPISPFFLGLTVVASLGLIAANTAPGGYTWIGAPAVMMGLVLFVTWCARAFGRFVSGVYSRVPLRGRCETMRWLTSIAIPVMALLVLRLEIPLRTTFALNRTALDRFAHQVIERGSGSIDTQFVGMYRVMDVEIDNRTVSFVVAGTDVFVGRGGFLYSPDVEPRSTSSRWYRHLSGPWYAFVQD